MNIEKLQEKKIKEFNKFLKDKNIESVSYADNYWSITFKNKSVFKCRGYIVDNSLICERHTKLQWFNPKNK